MDCCQNIQPQKVQERSEWLQRAHLLDFLKESIMPRKDSHFRKSQVNKSPAVPRVWHEEHNKQDQFFHG